MLLLLIIYMVICVFLSLCIVEHQRFFNNGHVVWIERTVMYMESIIYICIYIIMHIMLPTNKTIHHDIHRR